MGVAALVLSVVSVFLLHGHLEMGGGARVEGFLVFGVSCCEFIAFVFLFEGATSVFLHGRFICLS